VRATKSIASEAVASNCDTSGCRMRRAISPRQSSSKVQATFKGMAMTSPVACLRDSSVPAKRRQRVEEAIARPRQPAA
jgi:hypothetical protein